MCTFLVVSNGFTFSFPKLFANVKIGQYFLQNVFCTFAFSLEAIWVATAGGGAGAATGAGGDGDGGGAITGAGAGGGGSGGLSRGKRLPTTPPIGGTRRGVRKAMIVCCWGCVRLKDHVLDSHENFGFVSGSRRK